MSVRVRQEAETPSEVEIAVALKNLDQKATAAITEPMKVKKSWPTKIHLKSKTETENMVGNTFSAEQRQVESWNRGEEMGGPTVKPRVKSVFPAKRKSVKMMMYESIAQFITSMFDPSPQSAC